MWCKLGEIFYLKAGENITSKDISEIKKEDFIYPCYGGNGIRGYTKQYNKEGIFSLIGRQGALCGNINIGKGKFFATEHAVVVNAFSETNVNWCFYFLKQLNLNQYATSTAQPGLSVNNINQIYIPLPPLKEQDRIANEIDRLFTLIEQLEEDKAALEQLVSQLKSKILSLAICGQLVPQDANDEPAEVLLKQINPEYKSRGNLHYQPFEIPKSWVWVEHQIILGISGGAQPSKSYFSEEKSPNYVRLYQIRDYGDKPMPVYIPKELANKLTQKGDILLARYGGSLGKVFIAEEGAYNVAMAKIVFKFEGLIDKDFAYYYYLSEIYQDKLKSISRTAQAGFNSTDLSDMLFVLPPYNEQKRIAKRITELFNIIDEIQNALNS